MQSGRSYIIWMPRDGSGKPWQVLLRPGYIKTLMIILLLCVFIVPILEIRVFHLNSKISELQQSRAGLETRLASLKYLKKNLAQIEMKDRMLSNYFGIGKNDDLLSRFAGEGGSPDISKFVSDEKDKTYGIGASTKLGNLPAKLRKLDTNLDIFSKLLKAKDHILEYTPDILPVDSKNVRITSGFGWRKNPFTNRKEFHAGIDIAGARGTKIIAPANGIVIKTGYDRMLGNYIVLQHSKMLKTIYGHLSRILVKEGNKVKRGDTIALMGDTGLSTGSHLHYSVVKNSRLVNPMEYILDVESKS